MPKKLILPEIKVAGEDYELNLPSDHLSFSQIDLYLRCPHQYYQQRILGKKEPPSPALVEGSILGKVLEDAGNVIIQKGKPPTLRQALALHKKHFGKEIKTVKNWGEQTPVELAGRGSKFIEMFWEHEINEMKPVTMEKEFTLTLAGVDVTGFVDLLEEHVLFDFKCAKNTRFYNSTKSLQLAIYAVAMKISKVGYIVFCKDKMKIEYLPHTLNLTRAQRWVEFTVSRVAEGISKGIFPPCSPAENFLCSEKFCPAWSVCRGAMS